MVTFRNIFLPPGKPANEDHFFIYNSINCSKKQAHISKTPKRDFGGLSWG
jgi:hypothetical protein